MAAWDEAPAVVIDNGTGNIKCGYAGEDVPRALFAGVLGYPRDGGEVLVGDEAVNAKRVTLKYPIEHGIVGDWDGLEKVWAHAFRAIEADPKSQACLVTEAPLNPKANREKMAQMLFEKFAVPALHIQIQAVLTLYCVGRTEGCVLDSGDGVTHAVPVFEGHTVPTAIKRLDLAGRDLTEWMMELLSDETDRPFTTTLDREAARMIKEKHSRVSLSFDEELDAYDSDPRDEAKAPMHVFVLPDGQELRFGRAAFCCPELMFNPSLAEKPCQSVQTLVHDSIQCCPVDIRRAMYRNIVLSGGNTMFEGTDKRLQAEVGKLVNARVADELRVIAPGERKYSVWMGGALLASLTSFSAEWVTKQEYDEAGPNIIHSRCNSHTFVGK
jgi:actin-related protein